MEFKYQKGDVKCETNSTLLYNIESCGQTGFNISICSLVEIIVLSFIGTLLVGRWTITFSKRMISNKDAIYNQVSSYTSISADVIEIAQYMQNQDVSESLPVLRTCQVIFGISLTQFCFSLSAVKKRNMKLTGWKRIVDVVFSTEAWSLLLALFSQELPCCILRLILIFSVLSEKDYSLYFFVLKNSLMIVLLAYRSISLSWGVFKKENKIKPMDS